MKLNCFGSPVKKFSFRSNFRRLCHFKGLSTQPPFFSFIGDYEVMIFNALNYGKYEKNNYFDFDDCFGSICRLL